VVGQARLDLLPLVGEAHVSEHKLRPMAKVESKRGSLSQERLRQFLQEMLLIRHFEEKVEERFRAGELPGFLHVAIGQAAVAAGRGSRSHSSATGRRTSACSTSR